MQCAEDKTRVRKEKDPSVSEVSKHYEKDTRQIATHSIRYTFVKCVPNRMGPKVVLF